MTVAMASPAKRFFVEMLTRDIELADAVLDLLDNCVDGALRTSTRTDEKPYTGFFAHIKLSPEVFEIKDNCGGISRDLAETYAFRFGRPDRDRDEKIATVGVYGIGMKRAIFKLGSDCNIASKHGEEQFAIHISKDWIEDDKKWDLEMSDDAPLQTGVGTTVQINKLHPAVQIEFSDKSDFVDEFKSIVQKHYSYILEKGFEIRINDESVRMSMINTLIDIAALTSGKGIAPYVYETEWDGVNVRLVMGLYQRLPSDLEQEASEQGTRNKESAGWTIICNDRVVVSADKSRLTGWGEAGVPAYHSQFIALAGVVTFRSNDAKKLPVTTTKRGIDQNSELFGQIKEIMREALKHFTDFTNKWKGQSSERDEVQSKAEPVDVRSAPLQIAEKSWTSVRKGLQGRRFVPELPKPDQEVKSRRIQFTKSISEIETVGAYLLEDAKAKPAEVGIACFEWALKKASA